MATISGFITLKTLGMTSRARLKHVCDTPVSSAGLILDAGCGAGEYVIALALRGCNVVGVDADVAQLTNLARTASAALGKRCNLVAADLTRLPFKDSSFQMALCMEVINTIENDQSATSELARVLKSHGSCMISAPNIDYPLIYDPINKLLQRLGHPHVHLGMWSSPTVKRLYSPSQLCRQLQKLGLQPLQVTYVGKWLVPLLENYLALLLYYKVLAQKLGGRVKFAHQTEPSQLFQAISKVLDLTINLDRALGTPGTHFIIRARKREEKHAIRHRTR